MADKPVTREEKYLAYLTGDYTGELPKPITRKEKYLYELCLKGIGGEVSPEEIKNAVNEYLEKNPVKPGATTEQAQQIEQNKTDIASLKEGLSNKITKFYASNQGEAHITDSDNGKIVDMMIYGKSSQDGTPSPENPVEIKSVVNPTVKVVGKNLLKPTLRTITKNGVTCAANGDGTYTLNGTATSSADFYLIGAYDNNIKLPLNPTKKYVLKGTGDINIQIHAGTAGNTVRSENGQDIKLSNMDRIAFIVIRVINGSTVNSIIYPQLEEGSTTTTYEPYTEQTVTLPYTLNAIPVSSGGNVTIDGQQYVADYVDVERGKLIKRVYEYVFSGVERWNVAVDSAQFTIIGYATMDSTKGKKCLCSCLIANALNETRRGENYISTQFINDVSRIWISPNVVTSKLVGEKVFLALTVPEEIPLTQEEITAFKSLATYYPTTNISVNSEQLDGYTVFNYPISMQNGWNYVKQQLNDNRDYIYDMDLQSAEAYVNSEYAVALTELEV